MPVTAHAYEHLDCSRRDQPRIAGKSFKIFHLIREYVAYGWSAEELALNHPQLTLGEVYAALANYADHREEMDRQIAATENDAERMHGEPRHSGVSMRLKR